MLEVEKINNAVEVIHVLNPFDPSKSAKEYKPWLMGMTIADCTAGYEREVVCAFNGGIVEKDNWSKTIVGVNDSVVICPVPEGGGGGGGKSMLRLVAMMILMYYTMGQGAIGEGMWAAGGTMVGWQMAAYVGGVMLINAAIPPSSATDGGQQLDDSTSYGVDGAKNVSKEGIPVPAVYGTYRVGGNIIGTYVENVDDTQYVNMLINAGEGPIAGIEDVQLNDLSIDKYVVEEKPQIRFGTANQSVIDWFNDTITPKNYNKKVTEDWSYFETDTVDKIRMDFSFPGGLRSIDGKGTAYARTVTFSIQMKGVDEDEETAWVAFPAHQDDVTGSDNIIDSSFYEYYDNYVENGSEYFDGDLIRTSDTGEIVGYVILIKRSIALPDHDFVFTANSIKTLRKSLTSITLEQKKYDIRIKRIGAESLTNSAVDSFNVTDVNEIIIDNVNYKHTALLAIKVRLSDQLNGLPKVTFIHKGRLIRVIASDNSETLEPSNNPAWITLDALTNSRFGAGVDDSRINLQEWKEWADFCDNAGYTFDGVIDTNGNIWESLTHVFNAGHARLTPTGTRFTVAVDRPNTPVMMFGMGNIVKDTFSISWLPKSERANEVEVSYFDKLNDYKKTTTKIVDREAFEKGLPIKSASITLIGIVDEQRAFDEGQFLLNMNRYIHQTVTFDAPLEAIVCSIGDLIYVQHDEPQWGYAGRTGSGSTDTVVRLDKEVLFDGVSNYKLLVHMSAVQRFSGVVSLVAGNYITLSGYDGSAEVKRLQINGVDLKVIDTFTQTGSYGVVVEDATGIAATQSYSLWDTDVIEDRVVSSVDLVNGVYEVTVTLPFSSAPEIFTNWMFGENEKVKKPFVVRSISASNEDTRTITALEYNESVYTLDGSVSPTPNYSSLTIGAKDVTIDSVTEELIRVGKMIRSKVGVHWTPDDSATYGGADVYASLNGGDYEFSGTSSGSTLSHFVELSDGDIISFKVVAYDAIGSKAPYDSSPTISHTVLGKSAPPSDVDNFSVTKAVGGFNLAWTPVSDIDIDGYEIREGLSWDSGIVSAARHSSSALFIPIGEAGDYLYHIRAIDTSGNYSQNVSSASLDLSQPPDVINFDCVQNGDKIQFQWSVNQADGSYRFEIREGTSWVDSLSSGIVNGNSLQISADVPGARKFWIKAIDVIGLYSVGATFSTTDVALLPDRNAIYVSDEHAAGYLGVKYQTAVEPGGELRLKQGYQYGEYVFGVDLGGIYRARNVLNAKLRSIVDSTLTWADADFAWNSAEANQPWSPSGDSGSVTIEGFISKYTGLDALYVEGLGLDQTLVSERGTYTVSQSVNAVYQNARFLKGLYVSDISQISWDASIAAEFNTSFWLTMTGDLTDDMTFWNVSGIGNYLQVGYRQFDKSFYLEDNLGNVIVAPYVLEAGERILVAVSQTSTDRVFAMGRDASKKQYVKQSLAPVGAFTKLSLSHV